MKILKFIILSLLAILVSCSSNIVAPPLTVSQEEIVKAVKALYSLDSSAKASVEQSKITAITKDNLTVTSVANIVSNDDNGTLSFTATGKIGSQDFKDVKIELSGFLKNGSITLTEEQLKDKVKNHYNLVLTNLASVEKAKIVTFNNDNELSITSVTNVNADDINGTLSFTVSGKYKEQTITALTITVIGFRKNGSTTLTEAELKTKVQAHYALVSTNYASAEKVKIVNVDIVNGLTITKVDTLRYSDSNGTLSFIATGSYNGQAFTNLAISYTGFAKPNDVNNQIRSTSAFVLDTTKWFDEQVKKEGVASTLNEFIATPNTIKDYLKSGSFVLENNASITAFETNSNYSTFIKSVQLADNGTRVNMTVGYEVYSYENTNGTETKTTISRNDYIYSYFNWYTLKDLYNYIAKDSKIIRTDIDMSDRFASTYQAKANYAGERGSADFFNQDYLSTYNTKFGLADRIIIHLTEQGSFGANDITGELHIHFNIADERIEDSNNFGAVSSDLTTKTFTGFMKLDKQEVVNKVFLGFSSLTNKGTDFFKTYNDQFVKSDKDNSVNTEYILEQPNTYLGVLVQPNDANTDFVVTSEYDVNNTKKSYYFHFGGDLSDKVSTDTGIFNIQVGLHYLTATLTKITVNPTEKPKNNKYTYLYKGHFNFTATVYANDADNFSSTDTVNFEIILQSDI